MEQLARPELELRRQQPHIFPRAGSALVGPFDSCDFSTTLTHANIHDAIEAAWTYVASLGGGEVVVLESDYGDMGDTIDSQGDNVVLRGMGYGSYLHTSGVNDTIRIAHHYTTIKNLRVAQTSIGNDNDAIEVSGSDYTRLQRLWITDADRYGINFDGATEMSYAWILENYILNPDTIGLIINLTGQNLFHVVVAKNIIVDPATGIDMNDAYSYLVDSNIIFSSSGRGIWNYAERGSIINNIVYDPGNNGIHVAFVSTMAVVIGNVVYSSVADGIYVVEANYVLVSNNLIYDPTDDGIEFDDADYCTCKGNTIYSSGDDGIVFDAGKAQNMFSCVGNTIISSAGIGISVLNNLSRDLIASNLIYDPSEHGINGLVGTVIGNYVYSPFWAGIYAWKSNTLIAGNYFYDCNGDGIEISGSDDGYICGNYIYSSRLFGIEIRGTATGNVVTRNWTRGNGSGCLNIAAAADANNRIFFNNFDEGNITDGSGGASGSSVFDNYDPSANAWIAMINAPAGGR